MRSVTVAEAESKLSSLAAEVRASCEPIELREHGEPAAYLVEVETFKRLRGIEDSVRALRLRQSLSGPMYGLEETLAEIGFDP